MEEIRSAAGGDVLQRVWVSPSTVDRVLARTAWSLRGNKRPARSHKTPWPEWTEWRPNQLWCWDGSQFEACAAAHLLAIEDPAVLATELERIRVHYNGTRLHEAIGYVTPDDEHQGRGDAIRKARIAGLEKADADRRSWHRNHRSRP